MGSHGVGAPEQYSFPTLCISLATASTRCGEKASSLSPPAEEGEDDDELDEDEGEDEEGDATWS